MSYIKSFLDFEIAADRERVVQVKNTGQLTIKEILSKLEVILEKYKDRDYQAPIYFDFCGLRPIGVDSWRGIYKELSIEFNNGDGLSLVDFHKKLKNAIDMSFQGYKGGEFVMNENTPVWVDSYGESTCTAVVDIIDYKYKIIIVTKYIEPYKD